MFRFKWCNPHFCLRTTWQYKDRKGKKVVGGKRVSTWANDQDWPCCYKNTSFHQPFYANGEDQVFNQTSRLLFYFSSSPLRCFSAQTFHEPLLCPYTILLLLFLLFVSFVFPPASLCLLSNWYEKVTLRPSGVKWYKVIGRSSLLTGWPRKGLLEEANQVLLAPPKADPSPQLISRLCHMTRARRQREDD